MPRREAAPRSWAEYWSGRTTPGWRFNSSRYYELYSSELRALFADQRVERVLELGCGDGALFPYFPFEDVDYHGVDFSESMLARFQQLRPSLRLTCAPAQSYRDDTQYDLIISNGLIQYFDPAMVLEHFINARAMLAPCGRIICGSVLWSARRLDYYAGRLGGGRPVPFPLGLPVALRRALADRNGRWYSIEDFRRLAVRGGFDVEFFGSIVHLYRFNAVLTARDD